MDKTLIEQMIVDADVDDENVLIDYFSKYRRGTWIFISVVLRTLKLDRNVIFKILNKGIELGVLGLYITPYCFHCGEETDRFPFQNFKEKSGPICKNCGNELHADFSHVESNRCSWKVLI